jgi:segregation and condensation protein A
MEDYKVQLDSYSGPLDLLLYLIRREEVDVYDIPISRVLEQYLAYVKVLQQLDPDTAGEFLVLAATLMEIKSRLLLPKPPPEVDDGEPFDPRADLVRQLLAYKVYRDAAGELGRRAEVQSQRFPRPPLELPEEEQGVDMEDVQIWDLLTAFNKLLAAVGRKGAQHEVVYDDTPIMLHAADILDRLEREGSSMVFERIFEGRNRGEMIGLFLAMLELIRQDRIRVEQAEQWGPINVHLLNATPITTVMESADQAAFKELDERPAGSPLPIYEEVEDGTVAEPVFLEEEPEEEDEFSRQINSVQVQDVDLGRVAKPQNGEVDAQGEDVESNAARDDGEVPGEISHES